MNRAERRRAKKAGIPVKKEPVVNIKAADVVSLEDIHLTLKEETGITIVSDGRLKDRGN